MCSSGSSVVIKSRFFYPLFCHILSKLWLPQVLVVYKVGPLYPCSSRLNSANGGIWLTGDLSDTLRVVRLPFIALSGVNEDLAFVSLLSPPFWDRVLTSYPGWPQTLYLPDRSQTWASASSGAGLTLAYSPVFSLSVVLIFMSNIIL